MSKRLTAEPGTIEFKRQLLEIARASSHPIDKALVKALSKEIGEMVRDAKRLELDTREVVHGS